MGFLLFLALLVFAWQGLYWLGVELLQWWKPYALPSPLGVAKSFLDLCQDGRLFEAAGNSLLRGIAGYALALAIGMALGIIIHQSKYLQKNLKPMVLGVQTLPSVCWVPFSILWFGLTDQAILFVVVMGSAFSVAISVDNAIQNVQPIYTKAALTLGADKRQLYFYVILPACLPELVAGMKQGWSFAWRALMAGEVMTTSVGLGQTLIMGRDLADINQVMLVMVVIVLAGVIIDKCFFLAIERRILRKRGLL